MTDVTGILRDLQWHQLVHDDAYHRDIASMPPATRMKHFALHMAKYAAYLLDADDRNDSALAERALVDAFAIILAVGNTLGQDLSRDLAGRNVDIRGDNQEGSVPVWRAFIKETGALAKACESLDHIEDLPFKALMKQANTALAAVVLHGASVHGIDIVPAYKTRLRDVEKRSPFDDFIQQRQPVRNENVLG
ncbi:hypothetical protein [Sphingomonas kyeonggiensis]|uniref:Uncharacterized protein n=1 Tax=Sphingomonas kyeonggiensis TaxID=1268553 RepID=A0A7W6NVR6_9SPHN|nr:hypothetical protein [Sphingomonas kyeonggiensis]MBB4096819.1 hypothetical protein [Sphingomonas kyeonggiensis]